MSDQQIRDAYERLQSDVDQTSDPARAYRSVTGGPQRPRGLVVAVAAAVVVLVIGLAAILQPGDEGGEVASNPPPASSVVPTSQSTPSTSTATAPTTDTTTATSRSGVPDNTIPGRVEDPGTPSAPVPTHRVSGVAADDVLNVRHEPDPAAPVLARLAPAYAGIEWTGEQVTALDGGTWYRVVLLDPVRLLNLGEPLHGGAPAGWVNAAFLAPIADGLAIDFDRLACELGGGIGAVSVESEGPGQFPADHVYGLDYGARGDCHRIIISLGSAYSPEVAWELIETDLRPADQIPAGFVTNEERMMVSWKDLMGAREEAMQVETPAGPVLVTRDEFDTFAVVFTFPVKGPNYRTVPEEGRVVIDYQPFLEPTTNTTDRLVVVPPPVVVEASDVIPAPIVVVEGWARPFEATLHIELTKDGLPVDGNFSGSSFLGEVTGSEYAVMTTTWAEAWGQFHFEIEGLDPGDYELFLSSGGGDVPVGIRVAFTVPEQG